MTGWRLAKGLALGVLLLFLGGVGYLGWQVNRMAAADQQRRCADLARGKEVVAALDALVARGQRCPAAAMQKRAASEPLEWELRIDSSDCSYTLAAFTVPGWPISASVRLGYDSHLRKWESVCEGHHSLPRCP
jgi:hypothetical protein